MPRHFLRRLNHVRLRRSPARGPLPHQFDATLDRSGGCSFIHYGAKMQLHVVEIVWSDRTQVHFGHGIGCNGIHRDSAAQNADVVRRPRTTAETAAGEMMHGRRHGMNGIWPAEIGPTVTSGTRHANAKSPASQCLVRDALNPSAIERNEVTASVFPG